MFLKDEKSEKLRAHFCDVDKYIINELKLNLSIRECSSSVNDDGAMVIIKIGQQIFRIEQNKIIESTFHSGYAHHLVTRTLENGFSNDEYFNLSLVEEVNEILKEENISKIRKYLKDALHNYLSYIIELENKNK